MTKIDTGSAEFAAPGRLTQLAGAREEGWQHALERAFLAEAGAHRASTAPAQAGRDRPPPRPADASPADAGLSRPLPGRAAHAELAPTGAVEPFRPSPGVFALPSAGIPSSPSLSANEPAAADTVPQDETTSQVRLAWGAYARSADAARAQGLPAEAAAPATPVPAGAGSEVAPQHVFFERTGQGAVVWIRHADATPAQLRSLVTALLQQARASGVPLVGVRINGTPMDLPSLAGSDQSGLPIDPEAPAPAGTPVLSRRDTHGH